MNSETQTVSIHPSTRPLRSPRYKQLEWTANAEVARIGDYSLLTLIEMLRETRSSNAVDDIQDRLFGLGADAIPTLTKLAMDSSESVRVRTALLETAAGIDVLQARVALLSALADGESRLRATAVEALTPLLGEPTVRDRIAALATHDSSSAVRSAAEEALQE